MVKIAPWDTIKNLAIQGVPLRQLAREFGLPAGTLLRRAHDEKWNISQIHGKGQRKYYKPPAPIAAAQKQASDQGIRAVSNLIEANNVKSRLALSAATAKAADHLEHMDPNDIVQNASQLHAVSKTAAQVFGWNSLPEQTRTSVVTNILMLLDPDELTGLVQAHPNWQQIDWENFARQRFPYQFQEAQSRLIH